MSEIFDAYNLPVEDLVGFYHRLNETITYPDGMKTCLGIIYWGRDEHLGDMEESIPGLIANDIHTLNDILQALRTPTRAQKVAIQAGIPANILRILKHDAKCWLPEPISLVQIQEIHARPDWQEALGQVGLDDQLEVISAGKTPLQREKIAQQTGLTTAELAEIVKLCDFYRTGKNIQHIRSRIYYDMGMDTWQKWAWASSEEVIARFTEYIQNNSSEGDRLIPWPKEVRNGIEWAKMHLEIYSIEL